MKRTMLTVVAVSALAATAGCVPGPNELVGSPGPEGDVAGFWLGLWHGFIVLFTFIASLFYDSVEIYEVHNNGAWYGFGYVFGMMMFFGGGGHAGKRSGSG